jgi:hypothetical protein
MRQFATRFFEAVRPPDAPSDEAVDTVDWQARLVCLDIESGGLCIETRPLSMLPPFAKKLSVVTGTYALIVLLASNLRTRISRTPVPPSCEPYQWSAPGHEEMLDDDLAALQVPGLAQDAPTLFRVDAAGIGQPLVSTTISAGSAYRLVIPPTLVLAQPPVGELYDLDDGWQLWEFSVPSTPGLELRDTLRHLGLELGKAAPSVRWVLRSPMAYEQTPRGEAYPVSPLPHARSWPLTGFAAPDLAS